MVEPLNKLVKLNIILHKTHRDQEVSTAAELIQATATRKTRVQSETTNDNVSCFVKCVR